jgi:hypothetical protein
MALLTSQKTVIFTSNERLYNSALIHEALFGSHTSIFNLPTTTTTKTAQEIIDWMRAEGLPIAAIADMARVERKSVYAWINGGLIRPQNQQRLEKLYYLLLDKKQAELFHLYRFWNRELASGESLSMLLCEEHLNSLSIKMALCELWPIALRIKKNSSPTDMKNNNPFLDEISEVRFTDDI